MTTLQAGMVSRFVFKDKKISFLFFIFFDRVRNLFFQETIIV